MMLLSLPIAIHTLASVAIARRPSLHALSAAVDARAGEASAADARPAREGNLSDNVVVQLTGQATVVQPTGFVDLEGTHGEGFCSNCDMDWSLPAVWCHQTGCWNCGVCGPYRELWCKSTQSWHRAVCEPWAPFPGDPPWFFDSDYYAEDY